jgi:putative cell wall-binding protein
MHRLPAALTVLALVALAVVPDVAVARATGTPPTQEIPETVEAEIEGFGVGRLATQSLDADHAEVGAAATDAADDGTALRISAPVEAPIPFSLVGFDLPDGQEISFRTSVDGQQWTAWEHVHAMEEGPDGGNTPDEQGRLPSSPAWVGEARHLQIQAPDPSRVGAHLIDTMGNADPDDPDAVTTAAAEPSQETFSSAGTTAAPSMPPDTVPGGVDAEELQADSAGTLAAAASRPAIVTRAGWGADESISSGPSVASTVTHVVVHHTASTNSYSAAEAPAQVRGFQRYHVLSNGWSDIGYNFLIDRYGVIYEGRRGSIDQAVIGAHAAGFNTRSIGVSLIGDFTSQAPTSAALASLRRLLAWKMGAYGIDPTDTVSITSGGSPKYAAGTRVDLPTISGHRDTGLTSCPGWKLYAKLGDLRTAVRADIGDRGLPVADYARQCLPEGDPNAPNRVWRAKGDDRVATSIVASKWYWRSATTAVIASAANYPDALAASAIAAQEDAPLLLTDPGRLDDSIGDRVEQMGATQAILMGGPTALSTRVESDLRARGVTVTRVAGSNRWATAAQAAARTGAPSREVALALGSSPDPNRAWPDALSAGSLAATPQRIPTLLTRGSSLPPETAAALRSLGARTVWILGDTSAISERVAQAVEGSGVTVRRLKGRTRYGTSVAAAAEARRRFPARDTSIVFASGANYPDALSAAAVAAKRDAPLLLVPPCALEQSPEITDYLDDAADVYSDGVILGGTAAVSERIRWQVGTALAVK